MKKILVFAFIFLLGISGAYAKNVNSANFSSVINDSDIEKNSIAISIKKLDTGKLVYGLNDKILMHPASVQKLLTLPAAVDALGEDYEFGTSIYRRGNDSFVIKLSADPYLTSGDLKRLANYIGEDTKKVYIDDSILEKKDWGEGWQWDDDMNVLMPKFNSYNLDKNLLKITVLPAQEGENAIIITPSKYPFVFLNNVVSGEKNNIKVSRDNSISPNALSLEGTINKPVSIYVPANNLKRYFDVRLTNILGDKNVYLKHSFTSTQIMETDKKLDSVSHTLSYAIDDILKNSNNMASETVAKLAGGNAYNSTGTDILGIKVFNDYCAKLGLDNSKIRITDASGVSKNNLISADFISEYLIKNKSNAVLEHLPKPGEGTLTHRMLPIKDNVRAKTGTHGDASAIAGYLTTKKGNEYAFCIIINDTTSTISDMKTLEDYLVREMYLRL